MARTDLHLEITGPNCMVIAEELREIISAQFCTTEIMLHSQTAAESNHSGEQYQKIEAGTVGATAGIVAAILCIPGAIVSSFDLKDRLEKKQQYEKVQAKISHIQEQHKENTIRIRIGTVTLEISRTSYATLTDTMETEQTRQ